VEDPHVTIYRDEHDALRAQVADLETRLEQSVRELAAVTARAVASESKLSQLREMVGVDASPQAPRRRPRAAVVAACAAGAAVLAALAIDVPADQVPPGATQSITIAYDFDQQAR
jgi:hypothetical protein